jgi:hypothetical protein
VLPRNHFQTYNTFWKRGEATDKQDSIWFVWLVQITKCEVVFISVCFIQQSILSPSQHFHSLAAAPFPSYISSNRILTFFLSPNSLLLNSSPPFPSEVFVSFCYRSGPYFPPPLIPFISVYTPPLSQPIPFLSFSITIFPFFLRHQMLVQFTQRGREAGRQALLALCNRPRAQLSCEAEYILNTILHSREVICLVSVLRSELWNESMPQVFIHNTQHRP